MWASKVARGLSRRVSRARSSGLGASSAMPVATNVLVRSMSTALSTSSLGRDSEAIERFANTVDLLSYYASKKEMGPSQMDGIGMVTILKQLASVGKGSDVTAMLADGRFHSLLSDLTGKLEDLEARYVVTAASSVAAFRTTTQELTEFTSALAEVVQRRPNAFTPNALSSLTLAFAARRFEDEELVYFVTQECKKVVSEAKCFDLILLLDGLNRWGVFDREIVDMSVERLCDQLDRFTSRDVTHLLGVMGQMALARGFLIRSVAKMMFENLHQFTPRQLCSSLYALVRLRFTTKDQVLQVFRVLEPEASIIPMASVSELIFVSASHGITPTDNKFVKHLCDRFVGMNKNRAEGDDPKISKKGDKGIESRPLNSLIDVAWAFCVFKDRPHDLKNITERIFSLPVPRSRLMLAKMFEVFGSLKLEQVELKVSPPASWESALTEGTKLESETFGSTHLFSETMMTLDKLQNKFTKAGITFEWEQNVMVGKNKHYTANFFDKTNNIALELDTCTKGTPAALRSRHMALDGVKVATLEYWYFRRCRTPEDRLLYIQHIVEEGMNRKAAA